MIRVTGGEAKGLSLKVINNRSVRPTSDRVRQALFNTLAHRFQFDWVGAHILDLYAGSGILGIEALSRGAISLLSVEMDRKTAQQLKINLSAVTKHLSIHPKPQSTLSKFKVHVQPVERVLQSPPRSAFDLVFIDPPYAEEAGPQVLKSMGSQWIKDHGLAIIEHAKRDLFDPPLGWTLAFRRSYGDTMISICERTQ